MPITVNGEKISSEEITAAAAEFKTTPDPIDTAARTLTARALLRQRAATLKLKADSEEAALEKLLEREVIVPQVSDEEVRRYYEGHRQKFRSGDLFEARHILFDGIGDVEMKEARKKAEGALLYLKEHPEEFGRVAKESSACDSARQGGHLGQLSQGSVVSEFWAALIGFGKPGLLPQLVETRYGLHIVLIDRAAIGELLPFEAAEKKIRDYLAARLSHMAYQQYISRLASQAQITGIDLVSSNAPMF